jgi:hypothetical protein
MIPVMTVEMSLAVEGTGSGRGSSPTGLGVSGVPPSTLRMGAVGRAGTDPTGEGGAIGLMTVGGRGRLSMGAGVVFGAACSGPGLIVGGCWTGGGVALRVGL